MQSYNDLPIYTSNKVVETQTYTAATVRVTGETAGTYTTLYIADWDDLYVSELTPLTIQPLAKVSTQYDEFEIFTDEVVVMRNPQKHAALIGIPA